MEHSNITPAKILIPDTGKFEQWKFRIHQYLQNEHYALWEVIEFGDSYEVSKDSATIGSTSDGKKGRTIAITTRDMQKRRNDTFGGNEATRKTKKNLLKQQYGNFMAEGKETLEQTFNRLQAIVSQLEFMDVEIEQDDLNQNRNEEDNTASVPTASTQVSPAGATVAPASISLDTACAYIASQSNGECRAPRSQDRERIDNYRQGSKVEEQAPKALMAIDGVGWDWSYMENDEENHAFVADEEAPIEFALMAKTSTDNEVFDTSLSSKACLSQVEGRLVEFKNQEIKFCKKIRGLEFSVECKTNRIENITNELETLKKEKEGLESKLTVLSPIPAQVYSPPKKDMSKTGLPEFADDIITDYTRPSPSVESNLDDLQNSSSSTSENRESTGSILSKPDVKFVKPGDSPTVVKTDKKETVRKPTVKYAELYRKTSKMSNACYNCGGFDRLSYDREKWVDHGRTWAKNNYTPKCRSPRTVFHKIGRPPMRTNRPTMNDAQPKRTSFYKPAHSYHKRPFQRTLAVRSQFRGPRVPTVNRKFPAVNRKFPSGNSKFSTADMGNKGKAGMCHLGKMDEKSAFIYGTIDEEVYMMQPPGFQDPKFPARVYKVEKAMYGLHQAPRAWYGTLSKYLLTNGFQRGTIDQTLFIKRHRGDFLLVHVYVDDFIFGSSNPQLCREFEALMHEKFQMSAMGELNFFLGMQVLQKKDGIFLSQDKHQVTPKEFHMHVVKRIFRYLKGYPKLRLWYPKESPFDFVAYSDSDYGGASQDRKSTTKGCQFLGRRLISWQCKKQTIVDTSTIEAEYVPPASGCGQVLWIQNQLLDYGHHFIRDCFEKKLISVDHIHTDENVADLLTKPFDAGRFQYLVVEHAMRGSVKWDHIIYTTFSLSVPIKPFYPLYNPNNTVSMARLAFCDYHNMIAILEKYEHNTDFHQIVDFVEASHLRKDCPLFPSMLVTICEGSGTLTKPHHTPTPEATPSPLHELSSLSLPPVTTEPLPTVIPSDTPPLKQYTRRTRIAQSSVLPPVADEPASPLGDDSQGKAFPTDSGFEADQDRANITKTSTLPSDSTPRVTSVAADEGNMQHKLTELTDFYTRLQRQQAEMASKINAQELEISQLKARVMLLEDKDGAAPILSSGVSVSISPVTKVYVAEVPTGSGSIPTASPPGTGVPTGGVSTGSDVVSTASPIFTTATVATPYTRRKGKEKMVESDTPKNKKLQEQIDVQVASELEEEMARDAQRMNEQIARDAKIARIHAEEELQMMIDGMDRNNETVAKYLQEYHQFAVELPIGRRIELISDLVKYQDNYAKVLKFQTQQRKPLSRKQQREFYMLVLRSHAGWKAKHFKGMTLEEIKEKFDPVWKQMQDFIPIGSKEEREIFKRKGLRLEQDSPKKALQVKHPIIDWEVHTEGERSYWKIIRLGGSTTSYQFFMDMLKHFDKEDLNQLWALVKETLNIRPAASDKEKELWVELKRLYEPYVKDQLWTHTQNLMHAPVEWKLYDTCGVHHVISKDQEMFMLVEKDYPLRKGLAIVMISYKLQGRIVGNKMLKAFPLPVMSFHCQKKFPLLVRKVPLLKIRDVTAEKIALLMKTEVSHGQRHIYNIQRRVTVTQLS
nr:hypothetical protein [Tanacetum cinerariifolium]